MYRIILLAIVSLFLSGQIWCQVKLTIDVKPDKIFIEYAESKQIINIDFLITNSSTDTFSLDKLILSVFDKNGVLIHKKFLDNNGTAPSIQMCPKRMWEGISTHLFFNPFTEFDLSMPIHQLKLEWYFTDNAGKELNLNSTINPAKYEQKGKYIFPLKGKILVYDAHDYNAHHRRFDYNFVFIKELGISANFMRFAYDFVVLNEANEQYRGEGKNDFDYFGFGSRVFAIAEGEVTYASNVHKDDKNFNIPEIRNNPLELYGNCIAIRHSDGVYSIYGHLKHNSQTIKKGDKVKAGQEIGQIGVSGSSFFPHLHFEMRTGIQNSSEGVPSYFSNVKLVQGTLKSKLSSGCVETGNILEITK